MLSKYTVTFHGEAPENVSVGDVLRIAGQVTVQQIDAGLVDVTSIGRDQEFLLGEITINLFSNSLQVTGT